MRIPEDHPTMTTTAAAPTTGLTRFEAAQKAIPTTAHQQPGTAHQRALEASIWPARPRVAGRQSVAGAVRAEWLKLRTLVSTWITSAITIAIMVLFGAGLAVGYAGSPERADVAKDMISSGSTLGMIVVAVLGALVVTGEYASGQIRSSVVAVPHRGRLFAAKALVVAAFSFILGVTSVLLSYAVSYPFMKGHAGSLTNTHYLGLFWGTGLSFMVIALMAMGLGYLTRSTAGAITVVVSLLFVVTIPLQLLAGRWQWAVKVLGLLPNTVADAVADPFSLSHHWGQAGTGTFLQHWQAIAVFAAWALVPMVIAGVLFTRRDV